MTGRLREVVRFSQPGGLPFTSWTLPVPKIPDAWLHSVVYLYPTVEAAEQNLKIGGTGFFVGVPIEDPDPVFPVVMHTYIVTNEHIAHRFPVVRVNGEDGHFQVLDLDLGDWAAHPTGEDLAVTALTLTDGFEYTPIPVNLLVSRDDQDGGAIGVGDEAFLIGRYVGLDGVDQNRATVRFGNIAALHGDPITQPDRKNHRQESFLVEMRSLSGYSGSPVFSYAMGAAMKGGLPHNENHMVIGGAIEARVRLLGIDWGHHPFNEPVRSPVDDEPVTEGTYIRGNSGMAMIVPAWHLHDYLMEDTDLMAARKDQENKWKQDNVHQETEAVMDSADPSEYPAFEDLTKKLLTVSKDELDAERKKGPAPT